MEVRFFAKLEEGVDKNFHFVNFLPSSVFFINLLVPYQQVLYRLTSSKRAVKNLETFVLQLIFENLNVFEILID